VLNTIVIDSDEKKAWIEGRIPPHVFNALAELPGRKRYVQGKPFIELSRSNLEFLDLRLEGAVWQGPAKTLVEEFRQRREEEKRTRQQQYENPDSYGFPYKHPPYDHQLKANVLARGKIAFGYFMEQGTGKTKTLLDDAADIFLNGGQAGKIDTLVIIAPNGVHAQWVNEQIPEHLTTSVPWAGGYTVATPTAEEASRLRKAMSFKDGLRVIAIHIDMMSYPKGKALLGEILRSSRAMLVVDESSRIKDSSSKRTKALLELGRLAKYRRILTGTPISQGVEDLYSQFAFLDKNILGYNSFYAFRNHFCRMGGFQNKKIVGYFNEEELKRKIDSYSYRVLKEDCLDLPEKNFIRQEVLFTDEQKSMYNKMKKDFFLDLEDGILTARMALTRLIRLQQLIGGFIWKRSKKDEFGKIVEPEVYQEFPNNRVPRTIEIIKEAQGKVIVWIKFEGDWRLLTKALDEAKIGWVDYVGTTPQDQRQKNIKAFREDPATKVFLSSPKSGGVGLNLTAASEVIWYSRDFSLENELQANDRCHRIGQHFPVNYHYLVTPKSVDERIDKVLKSKKAVAENLIDIRDLFADDE
jgi:hypothetical protein